MVTYSKAQASGGEARGGALRPKAEHHALASPEFAYARPSRSGTARERTCGWRKADSQSPRLARAALTGAP